MVIVVIPAYNEAATIATVVHAVRQVCDLCVVVDDGSKDDTATIARSAGAVVLVHEINRGQGAAIETGFAYARVLSPTAVVTFDADGQFDPADIPKAVKYITDTQVDIVFGTRFETGAAHVPFVKRLFLVPLAKVIDRLFGAPELSDVHNGFRVLTSKALAAISITQDRMAHATEIPRLAQQHGLRIGQFPVTVRYSEFGQGLSGGLRIVRDLVVGLFVRK
jgi:glycosyltransferase involved in cell wall biosynthesis